MWRIVSLRGSNVHTWQAGAVELGLVKITEKPPSIFPVLAESGGPFVYPTAFNEAKGVLKFTTSVSIFLTLFH